MDEWVRNMRSSMRKTQSPIFFFFHVSDRSMRIIFSDRSLKKKLFENRSTLNTRIFELSMPQLRMCIVRQCRSHLLMFSL